MRFEDRTSRDSVMRLPRFHLSTALIVMIAAGVLVGMNVRPNVAVGREIVYSNSSTFGVYPERRFVHAVPGRDESEWHTLVIPAVDGRREWKTVVDHFGWPSTAGVKETYSDEYKSISRGEVPPQFDWDCRSLNRTEESWSFSAWKIAVNATVGLAILLAIGVLCEAVPGWLTRLFARR